MCCVVARRQTCHQWWATIGINGRKYTAPQCFQGVINTKCEVRTNIVCCTVKLDQHENLKPQSSSSSSRKKDISSKVNHQSSAKTLSDLQIKVHIQSNPREILHSPKQLTSVTFTNGGIHFQCSIRPSIDMLSLSQQFYSHCIVKCQRDTMDLGCASPRNDRGMCVTRKRNKRQPGERSSVTDSPSRLGD